MDLQACLKYALEHNGMQKVAANDVTFAQQRQREGLSGYLPQVNGSVTFDDNLKRQTTVIPAGTFSPEEIRIQFGNQYNTMALVQVDQVIFDRSMLLGISALGPNIELAELGQAKTEQTVLYNAAMAWYQVQIYQEQSRLLTENESKLAKTVEVLKLQYEKGVARKVDYDRVAVALANVRAQQKTVANDTELALNRLKIAIGMSLDAPLALSSEQWDPAGASIEVPDVPSVGQVLDLKIQEKGMFMQELEFRRKKALYLPTLSAYARYGGQSFGDDFGKSFTNWFDFASVGLKLNVPLWNSMRTPAQVKMAELNLASSRENYLLSKANVELSQHNALSQWENAHTALEVNKENLALAQQVLDVTQLQFEQGVATLSDYLTADYAVKEAQVNYITALLRVQTARLEYEKAQGTLKSYLIP